MHENGDGNNGECKQTPKITYRSFNPLLHSQLRLAVMSLLISVESAEFTFIKEKTSATAGNLSVQLDKLEKAGYITIEKSFKGKRPLTTCRIAKDGIHAFEKYVNTLKKYIE